MTQNQDLFTLNDVSYAIDGRELLSDITTRFAVGQFSALVGHNGSGKSTLLKILARQQQASLGTITFDGQNLAGWPGRSFARKLAYLPQNISAATGTLVEELVAFGRYPWHGALGRFGHKDRQKVAEAIELTGIGDLAKRNVGTLSGGERQRVWLAMLVAQDAPCLLLDEPTSALDIAHQIDVLSLVRRLVDERKTSVIIVLHDINLAARYCDQIFALRQGKIIDHGPAHDLMTPERLFDIYGVRMDVIPHPVLRTPTALI
ncbi:ABC transporter ATP-binding protein [Thalassospira marina]|uniref:Iron-hydroxamate transporter ATP-binding subunit n=1 Tax=Thalassospira marina TaxID=2048283 RepID=A0A2N3KWT0_9PROT|nr:ATP-binding cassette domain-containing protein [Thalassospira marina]PKR55029.1 iron-hydroxamate transporter ATP-binding subunit [Thalassospira marina]